MCTRGDRRAPGAYKCVSIVYIYIYCYTQYDNNDNNILVLRPAFPIHSFVSYSWLHKTATFSKTPTVICPIFYPNAQSYRTAYTSTLPFLILPFIFLYQTHLDALLTGFINFLIYSLAGFMPSVYHIL